jgi:glyoxylase-like metal-dependent hydrolase (beta-lactamase superfamily II)
MNIDIKLIPPVSQNGCNAYLVHTNSGDILIDAPPEAVEAVNEQTGGKITAIILTHGHFDHIGGLPELVNLTGAEVFIHEAEAPMLSDTRMNLADMLYGGEFPIYHGAVKTVKDSESLTFGDCKFTFYNVPGHTPGLMFIVCESGDDTAIFTGDFIFEGSIGYTGFQNSNPADMEESLRRFLRLYGDTDYTLFPGHGAVTSVQRELRHNPFL